MGPAGHDDDDDDDDGCGSLVEESKERKEESEESEGEEEESEEDESKDEDIPLCLVMNEDIPLSTVGGSPRQSADLSELSVARRLEQMKTSNSNYAIRILSDETALINFTSNSNNPKC
jgi:proteasome lid subunit RPN8/RPN11